MLPHDLALFTSALNINFNISILDLQDERIPEDSVDSILTSAATAGVGLVVVNGCWPGDWPRVLSLASKYPEHILPQLGLHPWWVSRRNEGEILYQPDLDKQENNKNTDNQPLWLITLRRLLLENPTAGLGECGLDKGPKALARCSWEDQLDAFRLQLNLAEELQRPVSVHCVKSFGAMHEMLCEAHVTVPIVMHAWTGTVEVTEMFLKLPNVYFSMGGHLTRLAPGKALPMIRFLFEKARDRCLLESDAPDGTIQITDAWIEAVPALKKVKNIVESELQERQPPLEVNTEGRKNVLNTPVATQHMLKLVAAIVDTPEEEIAQATFNNAQRVFINFLSLPTSS